MIKNIISVTLLAISVALSFKHGWDTFNYKKSPATLKMMNELGIAESVVPIFGILAFAIGAMLLIPKTFFAGNVLNATIILLIMAFALRAGNHKIALMEIPFLALPLVMIWLQHPLKNLI